MKYTVVCPNSQLLSPCSLGGRNPQTTKGGNVEPFCLLVMFLSEHRSGQWLDNHIQSNAGKTGSIREGKGA